MCLNDLDLLNKIEKLLKNDYLKTSLVQRVFMIGYAKAADMLDELVEINLITPKENDEGIRYEFNKSKTKLIQFEIFAYLRKNNIISYKKCV